MIDFEEILERNNLDYVPFELEEGVYSISIPYKNNVTLAFISSFVADLSNNGYDVKHQVKDSTVSLEIFEKGTETNKELDINTSAAYYMLVKWAKKLNAQLEDLEVVVKKDTPESKMGRYGESRKGVKYGNTSEIYIINPEVNPKELMFILEYFDDKGVELNPAWFKRGRIKSVEDNEYLQSLGYSNNETYLVFLSMKDKINFNPEPNITRYR